MIFYFEQDWFSKVVKQQNPVFNEVLIDVSAKGFEPLTVCLEGRCSIQLSYAPIS